MSCFQYEGEDIPTYSRKANISKVSVRNKHPESTLVGGNKRLEEKCIYFPNKSCFYLDLRFAFFFVIPTELINPENQGLG